MTATRALMGGVFRLSEMTAWNCNADCSPFAKWKEFWSGSGGRRKLIAICPPDFTVKYMTATQALMGVVGTIDGLCGTEPGTVT